MNQRIKIRVTVSILLLIGILFAGLYMSSILHKNEMHRANMDTIHGTYFDTPRVLTSFHLKDTDGRPFTNETLTGHWTMMFFGFTNCGSICPTTMGELGKMYRLLAADDRVSLPKVYLISIDGQRDTRKKLAQYVQAFDNHFEGARGTSEEVLQLAKQFGIFYQKDSGSVENNSSYQFQHSGIIVVFNPQGKLVALLTPPQKAQALADDFRLISYN